MNPSLSVYAPMVSRLGKWLMKCDMLSRNTGTFVLRNRNFVETVFTFSYALEQIALIICSFTFLNQLQIILSVYVVISLTTFALQKLCMEFRIKSLEDKCESVINRYNKYLALHITEAESKDLNNEHPTTDLEVDKID